MLALLGMAFLVDLLFNGGHMLSSLFSGTTAPLSSVPPQQNAATATPLAQASQSQPASWPAQANLPPFPSGWEPDDPPPSEVVARANALLHQLWQRGAGATAQEMTGGRWITYQAQHLGSMNGVVAYRVKGGSPGASPSSADTPPGALPSQSTAIHDSEQAAAAAQNAYARATSSQDFSKTSSDAQEAHDQRDADGGPSWPSSNPLVDLASQAMKTEGDTESLGAPEQTTSDDADDRDHGDADQG
jgi:hypothetical protein